MSLVGVVFRWQVHQKESDATYLLASTILVTYVSYIAVEPGESFLNNC